MFTFTFLLLPVAAASGWLVANRNYHGANKNKSTNMVPRDYLIGLNFLLEEQPDKAVDIFIKMLEVDSDTVETHLALGNLFRRRGEVDRAIRIHQNLIARPHLDKQQRMQSLLALGQDYMRAGVLDRAERIFLEVVEAGGDQMAASLRYLLNIYQQEKAWEQAIHIARKIEMVTGDPMQVNVAHYHCELALEACVEKNEEEARRLLRRALSIDHACARASLLQGEIEFAENRYKLALRFYKQIKTQDPDFLSEAITPIVNCYEALGDENGLMNYLQECLKEYPRITIVLCLVDRIQKTEGFDAAMDFVASFLRKSPSIRGLQRLIELQRVKESGESGKNLHILSDLTAAMLKNKPIYRCTQCGFNGKSLHWLCPQCKNWSTVKPIHGLEGD